MAASWPGAIDGISAVRVPCLWPRVWAGEQRRNVPPQAQSCPWLVTYWDDSNSLTPTQVILGSCYDHGDLQRWVDLGSGYHQVWLLPSVITPCIWSVVDDQGILLNWQMSGIVPAFEWKGTGCGSKGHLHGWGDRTAASFLWFDYEIGGQNPGLFLLVLR